MNIVLIGMRGSGKTTVGKLIAEKLDKQFVETDKLIITTMGMPVADIVKNYSWSRFRQEESKIVADLASTQTESVIATGGGVVENEQNINKFKTNNDVIIWLNCSIDKIIERIDNDKSRPFITNADNFADDLRKVYKGREQLYKNYADITIVSEENAETVVDNIIAKLKERKLL